MRTLILVLALVLCLFAVAPASASDVVFLQTGLGVQALVVPTNPVILTQPVLALNSGAFLVQANPSVTVVAERKKIKIIQRPRPVVVVK